MIFFISVLVLFRVTGAASHVAVFNWLEEQKTTSAIEEVRNHFESNVTECWQKLSTRWTASCWTDLFWRKNMLPFSFLGNVLRRRRFAQKTEWLVQTKLSGSLWYKIVPIGDMWYKIVRKLVMNWLRAWRRLTRSLIRFAMNISDGFHKNSHKYWKDY